MGDAQMARATDVERARFLSMLDCLSDIELARPYLVMESKEGRSVRELAIRYNITKDQVHYQIKCGKNYDSNCKEAIIK